MEPLHPPSRVPDQAPQPLQKVMKIHSTYKSEENFLFIAVSGHQQVSNPFENSSFCSQAADDYDVNLPMPLSFALQQDDCNYFDDKEGDDDDG